MIRSPAAWGGRMATSPASSPSPATSGIGVVISRRWGWRCSSGISPANGRGGWPGRSRRARRSCWPWRPLPLAERFVRNRRIHSVLPDSSGLGRSLRPEETAAGAAGRRHGALGRERRRGPGVQRRLHRHRLGRPDGPLLGLPRRRPGDRQPPPGRRLELNAVMSVEPAVPADSQVPPSPLQPATPMLGSTPPGADMAENNFELPPAPPTFGSGPVIDPSSTAVPDVPRPTASAPPSTTSSPWSPDFETPTAPAAAAAVGATPGRRRRGANSRTRAIVGGTSVAAFLAILAAVGIHDRGQRVSAVSTGDNGSATSLDPG